LIIAGLTGVMKQANFRKPVAVHVLLFFVVNFGAGFRGQRKKNGRGCE
jgi:hypothetical protein